MEIAGAGGEGLQVVEQLGGVEKSLERRQSMSTKHS